MTIKASTINHLNSFQNAIAEIEAVMNRGEETHKENEWIEKTINSHVDHALDHLEEIEHMFNDIDADEYSLDDADIDQDRYYENLSHATTRCLMALELYLRMKNGIKKEA